MSAYRRLGADPPFGDPRRAHGVAMEGYYWRLWEPASGRSVMALCGVCRAADGPWAVVALAAHPGGFVRWLNAGSAWADPAGLGVAAWNEAAGHAPAGGAAAHAAGHAPAADAASPGTGGHAVLRGSSRRLTVDLGPDARLDVLLEGRIGWPRGAFGGLGAAQAVPGLPQYWHPHVLGAGVRGSAVLGGETLDLSEGWEAYAEKNWGGTFPGEWWWGQAGFGAGAVAAFAGGRLGGPVAATAIVVRLPGTAVLRFAPPAALVTAEAGAGAWRLCARSLRYRVLLEGEAAAPPLMLPVPVPTERRAVLRSEHHLGGRLRAVVRRGRRTLLRAESAVAGLEHGTPG